MDDLLDRVINRLVLLTENGKLNWGVSENFSAYLGEVIVQFRTDMKLLVIVDDDLDLESFFLNDEQYQKLNDAIQKYWESQSSENRDKVLENTLALLKGKRRKHRGRSVEVVDFGEIPDTDFEI